MGERGQHPDPNPVANVPHVQCAINSSRLGNCACSSGSIAADNEPTCTPSASQVASAQTMRYTPKLSQTMKRSRPSPVSETACSMLLQPRKWCYPFTNNTTTTPRRPSRRRRPPVQQGLRHDDAIMDFQWFSTVPWTKIKDLRCTTYVQPPARVRFALQQAQHAIVRAILHYGPSSTTSEPAWKVLLLCSWLLLSRPAENASECHCASFLGARLDLFWSEDWPALWALVRAECDVAPTAQTRTRTKAEHTEARVCKIATLARAGEAERQRQHATLLQS